MRRCRQCRGTGVFVPKGEDVSIGQICPYRCIPGRKHRTVCTVILGYATVDGLKLAEEVPYSTWYIIERQIANEERNKAQNPLAKPR